jgi:hypothetical protein
MFHNVLNCFYYYPIPGFDLTTQIFTVEDDTTVCIWEEIYA